MDVGWRNETSGFVFSVFFLNLRVIFEKTMGDGRQFCHHELPCFWGRYTFLPSLCTIFETARTELWITSRNGTTLLSAPCSITLKIFQCQLLQPWYCWCFGGIAGGVGWWCWWWFFGFLFRLHPGLEAKKKMSTTMRKSSLNKNAF